MQPHLGVESSAVAVPDYPRLCKLVVVAAPHESLHALSFQFFIVGGVSPDGESPQHILLNIRALSIPDCQQGLVFGAIEVTSVLSCVHPGIEVFRQDLVPVELDHCHLVLL